MPRKKTTRTTASRKKTARTSAGRKKTTGHKKSTTRKYSKRAGGKVRKAMDEYEHGELKSGRSGQPVKSRKQAIAIGLSEARREGEKVPPNPNKR